MALVVASQEDLAPVTTIENPVINSPFVELACQFEVVDAQISGGSYGR